MINEKIYQDIYDELSQYLTFEWEKLVVYLEYGKASYSFAFYVKNKEGYVKCYELPGVSEKALDASFQKIDVLVSKERSKDKDTLWTNITMIVTSTGNMHTDIDYTDLSGGTYQFKKEWKKKYLS